LSPKNSSGLKGMYNVANVGSLRKNQVTAQRSGHAEAPAGNERRPVPLTAAADR
jgi:hypothetical protein